MRERSETARRDVDVAVVGAGPGGAAAAIGAARLGLSVVLFEPQRGDLDKPCGEGLLPLGIDALDDLGIRGLERHAAPFAGMRYVMPGARPLDVPFERPGIALRRTELQARLQRALASEPRIERVTARAEVERAADGVVVRSKHGELRAAAAVVADGAYGTSAPWLERTTMPDRERVGVRARFRRTGAMEHCEVHLGRGPEVYLTPLPDGVVNVAALISAPPRGARGARELLDWALAPYSDARRHLGELETPPASRRLGMAPRRVAAEARVFVVGDSGGSVDPVLGCGTSIALATGVRAARSAAAIVRGAEPADVERFYARAYRREIAHRRRVAAMLQLASRHPIAARATLALGRAMPWWTRVLVAIAAGPGGDRPRVQAEMATAS